MEYPLVSIIVPIFNQEAFLEDCLSSIMVQSYSNIEVILVDDGSTDRSAEICEKYIDLDERFSLHRYDNSGMAVARNRGLDIARGEYVVFVDSDDALHLMAVNNMMEAVYLTGAEIVCTDYIRDTTCQWPEYGSSVLPIEIYKRDDAVAATLYQTAMNSSAWAHIYKTSLLDQVRFRPGLYYEDLEIYYRILASVTEVAYLKQKLYFNRVHGQSITGHFSSRRLDVLDVTREIADRYAGTPMAKAARDRQFAANYNMFLLCHSQGEAYASKANECWQVVKSHRSEVLKNKISRAKNRIGALVSYLGPSIVSRIYKLLKT